MPLPELVPLPHTEGTEGTTPKPGPAIRVPHSEMWAAFVCERPDVGVTAAIQGSTHPRGYANREGAAGPI